MQPGRSTVPSSIQSPSLQKFEESRLGAERVVDRIDLDEGQRLRMLGIALLHQRQGRVKVTETDVTDCNIRCRDIPCLRGRDEAVENLAGARVIARLAMRMRQPCRVQSAGWLRSVQRFVRIDGRLVTSLGDIGRALQPDTVWKLRRDLENPGCVLASPVE